MLKAVIFDFDGVLADTMSYHALAWQQTFAQQKIKISRQEVLLTEGMPSRAMVQFFSTHGGKKLSPLTKRKLGAEKRRIINDNFKLKIYKEIYPLIDLLKKQGLKLAVVTGSDKKFVQPIIQKEFFQIFQVVISGDDVRYSKPSPAPYRLALKKLNVKSSEALVIENSPLGIKSAKSAKIKTFALATTLNKKYLKQADKIFSDHKELLKYLKSNP